MRRSGLYSFRVMVSELRRVSLVFYGVCIFIGFARLFRVVSFFYFVRFIVSFLVCDFGFR